MNLDLIEARVMKRFFFSPSASCFDRSLPRSNEGETLCPKAPGACGFKDGGGCCIDVPGASCFRLDRVPCFTPTPPPHPPPSRPRCPLLATLCPLATSEPLLGRLGRHLSPPGCGSQEGRDHICSADSRSTWCIKLLWTVGKSR